MLADTRGIKINDNDKKELTDKFSTMPPYPEVPAALRKLRSAGFRLFCLTDNLLEVQTRQLEHGGIVDLFERRFSADGVKHHKPSRAGLRLCRERARRQALAVLHDRLPYLGHARRRRRGVGSGADQARRQRCSGSRSAAAHRRRRPQRRCRSAASPGTKRAPSQRIIAAHRAPVRWHARSDRACTACRCV